MKKIIFAVAISSIFAISSPAVAEEIKIPQTMKDCITLLEAIGPKAEKLSEKKLMELRQKAQTMDVFCRAGKFNDAIEIYHSIQKSIAE